MSRRYSPTEGQIIQAFTFALDPTPDQRAQISRFFGARRKAFNWTLDQMKADVDRYRATGESVTPPSFYSLRKRWNAEKDTVERLIALDRAKILGVTVSRQGDRIIAAVRVSVARPQQAGVAQPDSVVGVDVGVRRLATVATTTEVLGELANPRALEHRLSELRRLQRQRARRTPGSRQYQETAAKITRLHAEVAHVRRHTIHVFTTDLAKTHGVIVVEGLDVASLLQQKGLPGASSRRRRLSEAAMGEIRRQLRYKCPWYGSRLIEADRFFPSSKTCHDCGHVQDIGWSEHWTCEECSSIHQRDDTAAINLARWASLGSVGAPVKRGAERQTESHSAVGEDTRKGSSTSVGPNNSVRSAA